MFQVFFAKKKLELITSHATLWKFVNDNWSQIQRFITTSRLRCKEWKVKVKLFEGNQRENCDWVMINVLKIDSHSHHRYFKKFAIISNLQLLRENCWRHFYSWIWNRLWSWFFLSFFPLKIDCEMWWFFLNRQHMTFRIQMRQTRESPCKFNECE